jgi:hypothetical protein
MRLASTWRIFFYGRISATGFQRANLIERSSKELKKKCSAPFSTASRLPYATLVRVRLKERE